MIGVIVVGVVVEVMRMAWLVERRVWLWWWISKDEVRTAMKRMKSGKAVGPDGIPVDAWKCLGEMAVGLN